MACQSLNMTKPSGVGIPNYVRFPLGGLAGMAAVCCTHPLDLLKNRMQMSGELGSARLYRSSFHALYCIVRQEGLSAVYTGLSASLLRQSLYGTTRLGTYSCLLEEFSKDGRRPTYSTKAIIGIIAGVISGLVSLPPDVATVRMTVDGRLPIELRRDYSNVMTALYRIAKDEGVLSLWRGTEPTIVRSTLAGVALLATYSQAKETLMNTGRFKDTMFTHFLASLCSGLITSIVSVPADIAKTRMQNMLFVPGAPMYRNTLDVWIKITKYEGISGLWKGFGPFYARLAPQTVLLFVFMEEFCRLYAKYVMKQENTVRVM